jgi:hypothetical protein
MQAHVTEFGLTETKIAKTEGKIDVGVELGEKPGGVPVGGEELHDGFEVQHLVLSADGVALRAAVLEEFLALGGSDECHVFDSCVWADPKRSVRLRTRTAPGPRGVECSSSKPKLQGSR